MSFPPICLCGKKQLADCPETCRYDRDIRPPPAGWKSHSVYLVDVSFRASNPIHQSLLLTGFINDDGSFGNYCYIVNGSYDQMFPVSQLKTIHFKTHLYTRK